MLNSLPLKEYQQDSLDSLETYLSVLASAYKEKEEYFEFQQFKGNKEALHPLKSSYCYDAWESVKSKVHVPIYKNKQGKLIPSTWQERIDGCSKKIPNICMKVPTGGGKTLLAACSLGRISRDYFKSSRGLVLWVVPSTTIYNQTLKALANKEHPYRKQLDFESGGRTKILERQDSFNKQDVDDYLCVMVLMLQSFNVSKTSKDARKIYSDSGKYSSFFPEVDDFTANSELLKKMPNLVEEDMLEIGVQSGLTIKQSLGNVFRLCRPIVIIDEEHRAKSVKAIDNINEFNPKFILEFSATPRDGSNKLIDVGGKSLKQEQMIRLPINVEASSSGEWKSTLNDAHAKLSSLSMDAAKLQADDGTYIRPLMVIIAEPKKKGDDYNQVVEIKKYLIEKCQVQEEQIKIKLSEKDELKDEELLEKTCPVKYIITKDALREGWDCSFAYVLTILTQKNSLTALTQYTGRVLRQPYAQTTPLAPLNQAYVFCSRENVSEAVEKIKEGLEREGMGDIASEINCAGDGSVAGRIKVTQTRAGGYKDKIFLPTLNTLFSKEDVRPFDYYRDILGDVDWAGYYCDGDLIINDSVSLDVDLAKVDIKTNKEGQSEFQYDFDRKASRLDEASIDYALLTSQLTDKIPNAFEARRILDETIKILKDKGHNNTLIALNGHALVRQIKEHAFNWLLGASEKLFITKLKNDEIILKLIAAPLDKLNWEMGDERQVFKDADEDSAIAWEKAIFQPQYRSNFNGLEKNVALYVNKSEAVKWWHRLGVRGTEYAVQGWKRDKIYPDFLVHKVDGEYLFVETKGNHLENPDSQYKKRVFEHLSEYANKEVGEFELISQKQKSIKFNLVYEDKWEDELVKSGVT
jgi:type III restriction enzyme